MSFGKNLFRPLGVINLTPNSFSDGGDCFSVSGPEEKLKYLRQLKATAFDFGAESTAPSNHPITESEEWERYQSLFFPILDSLKPSDVLSFDTYRPQVIEKICDLFKSKNLSNQLVWNDVSGILDQDLFSLLAQYDQLHYVYSHNLCEQREDTSHHMDFVQKDLPDHDFILKIISYFKKAFEQFERNGLSKRVIFDPCFGFSKTKEQNLTLVRSIGQIIGEFSKKQKWMLGISRKSFLEELSLELGQQGGGTDFIGREMAHLLILDYWLKDFGRDNIYIRLHRPDLFEVLNKCQRILNLK